MGQGSLAGVPKTPAKKIKRGIAMKIMRWLKSVFNGSRRREMVEAGVLDFSGQGRNKYGK